MLCVTNYVGERCKLSARNFMSDTCSAHRRKAQISTDSPRLYRRQELKAKLAIGVLILIGVIIWVSRSDPSSRPNPAFSSATSDPDDSAEPQTAAPSDSEPPTFDGDPCTEDCSGHEAGYRWAEDHDIDDEDACDTAGENSDSPSFAEGCRDYVNGLSDGDDSDSDSDDDPN